MVEYGLRKRGAAIGNKEATALSDMI